MAKLSANGCTKIASATRKRVEVSGLQSVTDTLALRSDGAILGKTTIKYKVYGGTSQGSYSIQAKFTKKELVRDRERLLAAFGRYAEKHGYSVQ